MRIEIPDELAPAFLCLLEKFSREMDGSGKCEERAFDATPEHLRLSDLLDAFDIGVPVDEVRGHPDYTAPYPRNGRILLNDATILRYVLGVVRPQIPKTPLVAV